VQVITVSVFCQLCVLILDVTWTSPGARAAFSGLSPWHCEKWSRCNSCTGARRSCQQPHFFCNRNCSGSCGRMASPTSHNPQLLL